MKKSVIITFFASMMFAFTNCKSNLPTDISGKWLIETANGVSTDEAPNEAFITFGDSGRVNGCAGVNMFFGDYTLTEGAFQVNNIGMTRMMGPNIEIEDAVCDALNNSAKIKVVGNTATIFNNAEEAIITLKKAEE